MKKVQLTPIALAMGIQVRAGELAICSTKDSRGG